MIFHKYFEIDGSGSFNPQLFEDTVLHVIQQISQNAVGALVLNEVLGQKVRVGIRPAKGLLDSASYDGEWPAGKKCVDQAQTQCYPKFKPGSGPPMRYLPGEWDPKKNGARLVQTDPYFRPDEVLVHELFHRARYHQDLAWFVKTDDPYHDREEFFAITVTNVYRSVKKADHRLRGGHSTLFELLRTTSEAFWSQHEERIDILLKQMEGFTRSMSRVKCRFNPFRDAWDYQDSMRTGSCPSNVVCK